MISQQNKTKVGNKSSLKRIQNLNEKAVDKNIDNPLAANNSNSKMRSIYFLQLNISYKQRITNKKSKLPYIENKSIF